MPPPVITLITDFGLADEFVGVMKGVILSLCPNAQIVDISHQIEPQDVFQAALTLEAAYPYFPKGSIHVVVVDPGVGSDRRILAVAAGGYFFLGPDNGVLWPAVADADVDTMVSVTESAFFLTPVSTTFHGRDIFAPVAAHLANGVSISLFGPPIKPEGIRHLEISMPVCENDHTLTGCVVGVDRFGNLITNIRRVDLEGISAGRSWQDLRVKIKKCRITGLSESYLNARQGALLALFSSRDLLEIALCGGNAAQYLNAKKKDPIKVLFPKNLVARSSNKNPPGEESGRRGSRLRKVR